MCLKILKPWLKGKVLIDFGDPKKKCGDPKKGRDPQFENRWCKVLGKVSVLVWLAIRLMSS
jgi:hypothetical protein